MGEWLKFKKLLRKKFLMTNFIEFDAIKVVQPVGEFFCGVMNAEDVFKISEADVRLLEDDDVGTYLGIQRELKKERVKEINSYIKTIDATFPSSIILSIDEEFVIWDEESKKIKIDLSHSDTNKIASILDGQHRLAGFDNECFKFENPDKSKSDFKLLVTIFVGADISTQAGIFATVNLAQTKVNKSLVYDLQALANSRSPERTCHDIAVVLNSEERSPFYRSIKRLGVATPNIKGEFLTQATFVENLLKFISPVPKEDRDFYKRETKIWGKKKKLTHLDEKSLEKHIFRKAFVEERDEIIASNILNFFDAIKQRWPNAWSKEERKSSLNKAVGFSALMRVFKDIYKIENSESEWDFVLSKSQCLNNLKKCECEDGFFLELDSDSRSVKIIYESISKYLS